MEESVQEVHLEFTNEDKKFIRELIKTHIGLNVTTEEEYKTSPLDNNLSVMIKEDDSALQIKVLKKELIEEVFYKYLKNKTFEPVKHVNPLFEEPDINSNIKKIKCIESMPHKKVNSYQDENIVETTKRKTSELSQEYTVTPNQDPLESNKIKNMSVVEKNYSAADVKPKDTCFYNNTPPTTSITATDESEDVMFMEENYDNISNHCEKSREPGYGEYKESTQQSSFKTVSPSNIMSYQLTSHKNPGLKQYNNSDSSTEHSTFPSSMITPFMESQIKSEFQEKLTKNILSPTDCLYKLCEKCKWPKPEFSQVYCSPNGCQIFGVSVNNLFFQGQKYAPNKKMAIHGAAAEFLHYLGLECNVNTKLEKNVFSTPKKGNRSGLCMEMYGDRHTPWRFQRKPFDLKATPFQMNQNDNELYTDKIEVKNTSSNEHTDLRLKLERKRSMKKNH